MVTTTKTTARTEVPEFAQTIRDEMISNVKQAQKISLDATKTFMKPFRRFPFRTAHPSGCRGGSQRRGSDELHVQPGHRLLNAQREFALQLAAVLTPRRRLSPTFGVRYDAEHGRA